MAEGSKVGSIFYDLNLDDKKFQEGRQRVQKGAEETGVSFGKLTGAVALGNVVSNIATDAWMGLKGALGFVVEAGEDGERVQSQLAAAIQSTGGAAGVSAEMANQYALAIEKSTPISKDAALTAENMLLTFTNIGRNVFPQATQAVADMATRMNGGLTPSAQQLSDTAIQVGKALQDPIKGITALHRVGVNFTEQQKEQIKTMVQAGNTAGAQKLILAELGKEFGGSAAAGAETFSGALQMVKNNLSLMAEDIFNKLSPTIASLEGQLSVFVSSDKFKAWVDSASKALADNLPKAIDFISHQVIPGLISAFKALEPTIKIVFDVLKTIFSEMAAHQTTTKIFAESILALVIAFKLVMGVVGIVKFFQDLKGAVVAANLAMEANPIILIITAIVLLVAAIVLLIMNWKSVSRAVEGVWHDVTKFFTNLWHDVVKIATSLFNDVARFFAAIPGAIMGALNALPGLIIQLLNGIAFMFGFGLGVIYKLVTKWIPDIVVAFIRELGRLPGQVWNILVAVWNFITNALSGAWHSAVNLAGQIVNGIMSFINQLPGRMANAGNSMASSFAGALRRIPGEVSGMFGNILSTITGWAGRLASAIGGVASGMWNAFKKGIGKASPSHFERAFDDITKSSQNTVDTLKDHVGQLSTITAKAYGGANGTMTGAKITQVTINGDIKLSSDVDANNFLKQLTLGDQRVDMGLTP